MKFKWVWGKRLEPRKPWYNMTAKELQQEVIELEAAAAAREVYWKKVQELRQLLEEKRNNYE